MALGKENVFQDCVFSIVQTGELDEKFATQVCDLYFDRSSAYSNSAQIEESIRTGGGDVKPVDSDGLIDFSDLSHIISVTSDFPQYLAARAQLISTVTPGWVTHSLLKGKQQPIRQYTPDPNLFFSNVVVSCGDIPTGDKDAIIGAVLAMGGMESNSLTRTVTHICALSMENEKCQKALENNLKAKIVLPHWYVRSGSYRFLTNDVQV
jgi:hypothetical protein